MEVSNGLMAVQIQQKSTMKGLVGRRETWTKQS